MNMFKNVKLNSMISAIYSVPANPEKLPITMLFVLIDGYISGELAEADFLNDIKVILEAK